MSVKSKSRRKFLKTILSSLSVVGALFAFWPFIKSMQPGKSSKCFSALNCRYQRFKSKRKNYSYMAGYAHLHHQAFKKHKLRH